VKTKKAQIGYWVNCKWYPVLFKNVREGSSVLVNGRSRKGLYVDDVFYVRVLHKNAKKVPNIFNGTNVAEVINESFSHEDGWYYIDSNLLKLTP
jgi:hypothetical protein